MESPSRLSVRGSHFTSNALALDGVTSRRRAIQISRKFDESLKSPDLLQIGKIERLEILMGDAKVMMNRAMWSIGNVFGNRKGRNKEADMRGCEDRRMFFPMDISDFWHFSRIYITSVISLQMWHITNLHLVDALTFNHANGSPKCGGLLRVFPSFVKISSLLNQF